MCIYEFLIRRYPATSVSGVTYSPTFTATTALTQPVVLTGTLAGVNSALLGIEYKSTQDAVTTSGAEELVDVVSEEMVECRRWSLFALCVVKYSQSCLNP